MNTYRWADLREGMACDFSVRLTREMLSSFGALSGDENPLHCDSEFARDHGYRGEVAYGLLTSSFYSRLVGMHLPGRFALLQGIDIDFVAPAFVGDVLRIDGRIHHLSEAYRRVELRARICNQEALVISRAKIRVGLHE